MAEVSQLVNNNSKAQVLYQAVIDLNWVYEAHPEAHPPMSEMLYISVR